MKKFLISKKMQEIYKKNGITDRGTGKTLSFALDFISKALKNPGVPVHLRDHTPGNRATWNILIPEIKKVIDKLELRGFTISVKKKTLIFRLYE